MFLLSLGEKPFLAISRFRGRLFLGFWPLPPSSNLLQSVLSPFSDLCFHLLFLMLILLPPFLKGMWLQCMSLDNQGTLPVSRSWTQSHVQNFWPCKAIYAQVLRTGSWTSLVGGGLSWPTISPLTSQSECPGGTRHLYFLKIHRYFQGDEKLKTYCPK